MNKIDLGVVCPLRNCSQRRKRGHVMCPTHWAKLPDLLKSDIICADERNEKLYHIKVAYKWIHQQEGTAR